MSARPSATCHPYTLRPAGGCALDRAAGQLQRLLLQRGTATRLQRVGLCEHFERIVARRIGFRRRCADLHVLAQHLSSSLSGRDGESGLHQRAQPVAREHRDRALLPSCASDAGCVMLAEANTSAFSPPAIASRSVPDGPYFACTVAPLCDSVRLRHFGQRAAQRTGRVKQNRIGGVGGRGHRDNRDCGEEPHHAPGTVAFGKNSCCPLTL